MPECNVSSFADVIDVCVYCHVVRENECKIVSRVRERNVGLGGTN